MGSQRFNPSAAPKISFSETKSPLAVLRDLISAETYAGYVVGDLQNAHDNASPEALEAMCEALAESTGPRRRTPEQLEVLVRELPNLMQEAAAFRQKLRSALALVTAAQPGPVPVAEQPSEEAHHG